jgi:hypothetical protein
MRPDRKRLLRLYVLLAYLGACAVVVSMLLIGGTFQVFDRVSTEQTHEP